MRQREVKFTDAEIVNANNPRLKTFVQTGWVVGPGIESRPNLETQFLIDSMRYQIVDEAGNLFKDSEEYKIIARAAQPNTPENAESREIEETYSNDKALIKWLRKLISDKYTIDPNLSFSSSEEIKKINDDYTKSQAFSDWVKRVVFNNDENAFDEFTKSVPDFSYNTAAASEEFREYREIRDNYFALKALDAWILRVVFNNNEAAFKKHFNSKYKSPKDGNLYRAYSQPLVGGLANAYEEGAAAILFITPGLGKASSMTLKAASNFVYFKYLDSGVIQARSIYKDFKARAFIVNDRGEIVTDKTIDVPGQIELSAEMLPDGSGFRYVSYSASNSLLDTLIKNPVVDVKTWLEKAETSNPNNLALGIENVAKEMLAGVPALTTQFLEHEEKREKAIADAKARSEQEQASKVEALRKICRETAHEYAENLVASIKKEMSNIDSEAARSLVEKPLDIFDFENSQNVPVSKSLPRGIDLLIMNNSDLDVISRDIKEDLDKKVTNKLSEASKDALAKYKIIKQAEKIINKADIPNAEKLKQFEQHFTNNDNKNMKTLEKQRDKATKRFIKIFDTVFPFWRLVYEKIKNRPYTTEGARIGESLMNVVKPRRRG